MHGIIEEIRERGTEAAGKVINEEWVPIQGGLGATGGDDTHGRMPYRLSPRFAPHRGLKLS